jgi:hypothetical protein
MKETLKQLDLEWGLHKLQPILISHPLWNFTLKILKDDTTYPLHETSDINRKQDLTFALSKDNHKSMISNKSIMAPSLVHWVIL